MSAILAFTTTYVANLTAYLAAGSTDTVRTEEDAAQKFTDEYVAAVSKGINPIINNKLHPSVLLKNGPHATAYKQIVYNAMLLAKQDKSKSGATAKQILSTAFASAAIAFWTGAMLEGTYKCMPPGHVNMVPGVMVTFPGIVPPVVILPQPALPISLPLALSVAYAAHMPTIMFLAPAMILPFPAPPYPLPLLAIL